MPKPRHKMGETLLKETSLVGDGDNPHAHIMFFKSKNSGVEPGKEAGKSGVSDQGITMSVITKALGLPDTATEADIETAITKNLADLELAKADKTKSDAAMVAAQAKATAAEEAAEGVKKAAEIQKAALEGDETFTKFDGALIKKSAVGTEMYSMLKAANDEVIKARTAAETSEFAKRAESEFKHVGKVDDTVVLLRMAKRAGEEGKLLETVLKSYNDMTAAGFKNLGKKAGGEGESDDPEAKLDALTKAAMVKDSIGEAEAMTKVLQTPDGAALYAQMDQQ